MSDATPTLLDAATVAALDTALATTGPVACWGFESASPVVADAALRYVATRLVPADAVSVDCWSAAPEGERWKVAEIEPVVYRLHTAPLHRHVIGCWAMDRIDAAAADRLLKVLEEPPATMLVALAAPSVHELPTTLRSRLATTITLTAAIPADTPASLARLGLHAGLVAAAHAVEVLPLLDGHVDAFRAARTGTPARVAAAVPALAAPVAKAAKLPTSAARSVRAALVSLLVDDLALRHADAVRAGKTVDPAAIEALEAVRAAVRSGRVLLPSLAVALRYDPQG
jgi:hypothetical protein